MAHPQMGSIVSYRLDKGDLGAIQGLLNEGTVIIRPYGEGDSIPVLVTSVDGDAVSGHGFLEGRGSIWLHARLRGDGPGCWA